MPTPLPLPLAVLGAAALPDEGLDGAAARPDGPLFVLAAVGIALGAGAVATLVGWARLRGERRSEREADGGAEAFEER